MPEAPVGSLAGKTRQADENKRDFSTGETNMPEYSNAPILTFPFSL
jgi:hypothetical protein